MSTETKTNTTMSFVAKALAFLNITEEDNVKSVQKTAIKLWEKQIDNKHKAIKKAKEVCTELVDDLKEDLEYAKTEYKESFLNISTERMERTARQDYIQGEYQDQIANAKAKVDSIEGKIKQAEDRRDTTVDTLEKEIKMFEEFLTEIK